MQIKPELLFSWGAVAKRYVKGATIFFENETPRFFHQILEGRIKMYNISDEGKVFLQGIFGAGESFGEPPLLIGRPYPAIAEALEDTVVIRLGKDMFLKVLNEYPDLKDRLLHLLSARLYRKAVVGRNIATNPPDMRVISLLEYYKSQRGEQADRRPVGFTRQEIANFTGLRVETVIRTLIKLHRKGRVEIRNRKLYY